MEWKKRPWKWRIYRIKQAISDALLFLGLVVGTALLWLAVVAMAAVFMAVPILILFAAAWAISMGVSFGWHLGM